MYPIPRTKIRQISVGESHIVFCDDNGTVFTQGNNDFGQLGRFTMETNDPEFASIPALEGKPMKKIQAGSNFTVLLSTRGIVLTCGSSLYGCLGHGSNEDVQNPKIIEGFKKFFSCRSVKMISFSDLITVTISDIAVGYEHVLALSSDGDIYSWGRGKNGRLGHGNQETQSHPVKILTDVNFKLIFAGFNHSFASK